MRKLSLPSSEASASQIAHAIVNSAITTNPGTPCGCSLCRNGHAAHQKPPVAQEKPFRWALAAISKDQTGKSYAWLTPIDGVAVKVEGRKAEAVLAVVKAIEALEVKR